MKITAQDLLVWMSIVRDRGWRVHADGKIRDKDNRCPICSLAHEISDGSIDLQIQAYTAWGCLLDADYEDFDIEFILRAADLEDDPLRPALMQALGMV